MRPVRDRRNSSRGIRAIGDDIVATYHYRHAHTVTLTASQKSALLSFLANVWPGDAADVQQVSFQRNPENPSQLQAGIVGSMRTTDVGDLSAGMTLVQIDP
jgi:hypothetical protein